ncbi:EF-hand domain-containing protein [Rhodanobacter thiooxydans]|uniref:EF-hand domain-containing protein n=1 Tax=Rhodanobacter thiooxydans TaxID=416169 RepID=UPI000260CDA5|nr:EF-hand domain-containing protein [Rhodanobacter thiooxydans]EIL96781.1 hypothetical protein UUA_16995 [Rhodanobacter thiooxydans LCS2]
MKVSISRTLLAAMAALGLAASMAASAQDHVAIPNSTMAPPTFSSMDTNHDGVLVRSEIPEQLHDLRAHFDQYDVAGDHRLTEVEYASYLDRTRAQREGCVDGRTINSSPCIDALSRAGQLSTGWSKRYATNGK